MRIFLSYAREDEERVVAIYEYLSSLGHTPWMDKRNLIGGIAWREEIEHEIRRCDMFFMFLSPRSAQKRGIIQREIKAALDKACEFLPSDIFIVPILLEKCEAPNDLAKFQWIDLREEDWTKKIALTFERAERQRAKGPAGDSSSSKNAAGETNDYASPKTWHRIAALVAFIVTIGLVGTSIYRLTISNRIDKNEILLQIQKDPVLKDQTAEPDLEESVAAMEACNRSLTLKCMLAGGVRAETSAGRHLAACTAGTMLQSDDPSLTWKDVWTTSVYSYAPSGGGPGGGRDDDELKVGGWGDDYYTLISFALPTLAFQPKFAAIVLYSKEADVASTRLAVDRIAQAWDFPKGDRLWWKDRPRTIPTDMQALLAPGRKQWYMIDLTNLVEGWRDNTFSNHGIEIRPLETNNNYVLFVSSDASDKSKIPRLLFCP